jgi:L-alanine-DL-glutamate epimerase-like enolase superfamily enzyme
MQITRVNSHLLATPLKQPIRTAIHNFSQVYHVIVELETDAGIKGTGCLFAQSAAQGRLFQAALELFEPLIINEDPLQIESIWQKIWKAANFIGNSGVSIFALSAIDTALWDITGKSANEPLYKVLGAKYSAMPVYASGGLWLGSSLEEIINEGYSYVMQGFQALKIRIGQPRLEDDIRRVLALREVLGPEIKIIADANQGWDADTAIKFGQAVAEANLYWLEEPVPYYDLESSARIAAALDMPLATGETEYTYLGFSRLAAEKAADIWMPDLQRVGGITGWHKIATLAKKHDIPISPHLFPEISVHLALAAPTCRIQEHVDWWEALLDEPNRPRLVKGQLYPTELAGTGFAVSLQTIEKYRVS